MYSAIESWNKCNANGHNKIKYPIWWGNYEVICQHIAQENIMTHGGQGDLNLYRGEGQAADQQIRCGEQSEKCNLTWNASKLISNAK